MAVISCQKVDSYNAALLRDAVEKHFSALGIEKDITPDMHVVIKPNLLSARKPEQAVTTHPLFLDAIIKWLKCRGVKNITVADSPGGPYIAANLKNIYATGGYKILENEATLNYNVTWQSVPCREGFKNRSFNIIEPICKADYIINAAKLKTHSMTGISAGTKNLFGVIPGLQKPEMHYRHPDIDDFSNMLLEIAQTVAPDVTIIDAIDAMEGNGPNGGTPKHLGVTLASKDIFAQDWYACSLMGIKPETIAMLRIAKEKGLIKPEDILIKGDNMEASDPPFLLPDARRLDFASYVPPFAQSSLVKIMDKILRPLPKVNRSVCIGCGKCAESCPPQIIKIENKKAVFVSKGCISCFCCQEMCPVHAIDVKRIVKF